MAARLRQAGLRAICIEARQANAALKTMPNKTDRNDAGAVAPIMHGQVQAGPGEEPSTPAVALAPRRARTVLNDRTIENVVRAILRGGGLNPGTPPRGLSQSAYANSQGVPLVWRSSGRCSRFWRLLDQLARLTKQVQDIVREEEVCRRLMCVPGASDHGPRVPGEDRPAGTRSGGRETWVRISA